MAYNANQEEYPLPAGDQSKTQHRRTSAEHLPKYFSTAHNKKFLSATLDQLLNPGVAE